MRPLAVRTAPHRGARLTLKGKPLALPCGTQSEPDQQSEIKPPWLKD